MEDMVDTKNIEETEPAKAQQLVKDIPQDAACVGLDVKRYIVPETLVQRLVSWEGRTVAGGRRLNSMQDIKKKLPTLVLRAQCWLHQRGDMA